MDLYDFDKLQIEIENHMLRGIFSFKEDDFCEKLLSLLKDKNKDKKEFIKLLIEASYNYGLEIGQDSVMWGSR